MMHLRRMLRSQMKSAQSFAAFVELADQFGTVAVLVAAEAVAAAAVAEGSPCIAVAAEELAGNSVAVLGLDN